MRVRLWLTRLAYTVAVLAVLGYSRRRSYATERDYWVSSSVLELEDGGANIESVLEKSAHLFVCFGTRFCPQCRRLRPIFEDVAKIAKAEPRFRVTLASVSCSKYPSWCTHLKSVPALYLFRKKGAPEPYTGAPTREAMLAFLAARTQ